MAMNHECYNGTCMFQGSVPVNTRCWGHTTGEGCYRHALAWRLPRGIWLATVGEKDARLDSLSEGLHLRFSAGNLHSGASGMLPKWGPPPRQREESPAGRLWQGGPAKALGRDGHAPQMLMLTMGSLPSSSVSLGRLGLLSLVVICTRMSALESCVPRLAAGETDSV